jgi:hypothetical protein
LSKYKVKKISESNIISSENKQENQVEIMFETPEKIDKITLSGQGFLKVLVSV